MAQEIIQRQMTGVQGEQLALTTVLATLSIPRGRDGASIAGALLKCASDFRFQISPRLQAVLKTTDIGVTFTDATAAVEDRAAASVLTLSALSTLANGDYLLVGSNKPFGGIAVDVANVNSNASVMAVHYWNGTAYASITPTDGTISPAGTSLGADGQITWTVPADWTPLAIYGRTLYWVRISFSAALDADVTVQGMALLSKDANRGYGYAGQAVVIPLGSDSGALEAILGASTATLDITWFFGNLPQMAGAGAGGAVASTVANGADVTQGSTTDVPFVGTEDNTARTAITLLKGIKNSIYVSLLAILGATTGAGVITDADGTIQQYLRGIVKLLVAKITVKLDSYAVTVSGTATVTQGAAGAAAWPVHDDWAPVLVADVTDNDSDKTVTVPASTQYQPLSILVDLTTSADVGNRQLAVLVTTAADVVIAEARAGIVQAASLTRRYVIGVGQPDMEAFRDTDLLATTLPVLVLPAAYKIRVYDNNAVAAAADDMHVQLLVMSRAV